MNAVKMKVGKKFYNKLDQEKRRVTKMETLSFLKISLFVTKTQEYYKMS